MKRTLSPSPTLPALVELYELTNLGEKAVTVRIEPTEHRLPEAWPEMTLRHIRICGGDFDLRVYRDQKQRVHVQLIQDGKVIKDAMGSTLTFIIKV